MSATLDRAVSAAKQLFWEHGDTPDEVHGSEPQMYEAFFHSDAARKVAWEMSDSDRGRIMSELRALNISLTPKHPELDGLDNPHSYTVSEVERAVVADAIQTLLQMDDELMAHSRRRGELADNWPPAPKAP